MKAAFKKITLLIITTLFLSCSNSDNKSINQTSCLSTDLQNGIIAFYPFSNGSINDFSGNNYNLTNPTSASAGADRAGNPNCAFNFVDANNEFLTFVNPTFVDNFQTLPFSISLWYKTETFATDPGYELLIGRDTGLHCPDTFGQWSIGLFDMRAAVFGINEYSVWDQTSITSDWKHLAATCNGTDLKFYINGVLTTVNPMTGCGSINTPTLNVGDLFLGKNYTGLLDDVIIYNRVLPQSEITELYNLIPCCQ